MGSSPITPQSIVSGAVGIAEVIADGAVIYWSETRPDEGGRVAIMCHDADVSGDSAISEVTGPQVNVRTRVHEYGGGAWWVQAGRLVYSDDARGGELFVLDVHERTEVQLTSSGYRYADGTFTPDFRWVVAVRERHDGPESDPVLNEIVAVSTDGSNEEHVLVDQFDFVSSPRLSSDGRLVFVGWDHPNMPWDNTVLGVLAPNWISSPGNRVEITVVPSQPESIVLPGFTATNRLLAVTDRSNWWNLVEVDPADGSHTPVVTGEFEIATPGWVFGISRWCEIESGIVAVIGTPTGDRLLFPDGSTEDRHSSVGSLRAYDGGSVVYVGASHDEEPAVWVHDGVTPRRISRPRDLGLDLALLAPPEFFSFDVSTVDSSLKPETLAHGLFYEAAGSHDELGNVLSPLLVMVHGGPTAASRRQLDLTIRYWTSRGIAVASVDYRGSTLYGREYRNQLRGAWGVADVVDCVAAADFLASTGRVDPKAVFIQGGSAGGLTVLNALANYDTFSGGISRYGVSDLRALATDTHKFESRYLDALVGEWPEDEQTYIDRSPMSYPDKIGVPMLILQGSEDKVVPPSQAEMIVEALRENDVPVRYRLFEGEGHGFRSAETIIEVLEETEKFIRSPASPVE